MSMLVATQRKDLSRHLGTVLTGVQLRDLSDTDVAALKTLLAERGVIAVRDQHMTLDQQIEF